MRKSYRDDNGEKIFRYSIRKYHFGAASVAVAALMFFANGTVQAQTPEISPATESGTTKTSALVSDSSGGVSKEISEESPATAPSEPEQSSQGNQKLQEASDENKSLAKTSEEGKGEKQAEILQPRTLKNNQSDYDPIPLGDDEDDVRDGLFSSENPVTTIQPRSSHSVTSRAVQGDTTAPKVSLGDTLLPTSESAATTPLYRILQGQAFIPKLKVWDESGTISSLDITGVPNGVIKYRFGTDFSEQTAATEMNPYSGSTFSGNVADTQAVGQHIAQITVKDASNNVATYYLKYEVYPARVEAKQGRFGQVKDKALIHGDNPADYIKFKNANNQEVQKPADVEVTWGRKPSTVEAGINKTGLVKVTYRVTDENGVVRDEVQIVTINTPVYHATLVQNPFKTTYGREFVNKNQPRDGRRYIDYNGRAHFNLTNLRVYWESSNIRGEKFSDGTRPWSTNYLGKKREKLMVRYPGDNGRYDNRNDDYGARYEELDGTFIVKPVKPNIQTSLGKVGKNTLTVNNVNSGTTVVVYDAANPNNLKELGRTMVAKEGDYRIKNGVEVPLNSGVTFKKDQKIVAKVIYEITDRDQRTDSDVSDTWTVKESLIANGIHVIKGESYTGTAKDRIRYNDNVDADHRTALPNNATASWAQNPSYTTLGTTNYTANVTIPGQGSATVDVPVHVYAPASLKANSYNNKQGTLSNGDNPENYIEFKDGNTVVTKPNNVTVRWQGGVVPRINTPGHNRGVIEVVYPGNAGASSTVVKTFTVQLPTYHTTATATEYTRTIGDNFAKTNARDYATTHNWNVDGSQYVWKNDETDNREYSAENWGKVNGDWLGKKKNKVKVYYGNDNGSNSHSENLAEETEEITFITKPKTPSVTATALNGKAGQRNQQVTVNNVTPGTIVELYDGNIKIGSVDVPKPNSEAYTDTKTVTVTVNGQLPLSSNIRAKTIYMPNNANEKVESDFSTSVQSTTEGPQAPEISQNPENLLVKATVGQGGSTKVTLTYTDANGRVKEVGFTKNGQFWDKDDANADTTVSITNESNGTGEIQLQPGTAQEGSTVTVKQKTATSEFSTPATTKALGRLNGLTNVAQADGSVDITVPDTATKFDLTYRNQQNNTTETLHYSKDAQGRWGNVTGITADGNRFTLPKGLVTDGTTISVIASNDNKTTKTVTSDAKFEMPDATTHTQRENGDGVITLPSTADSVTVTYTDAQDTAKTVTVTKNASNQWTSTAALPEGVTLTGDELSVAYKNINDGNVKTVSTRGTGNVRSQEAVENIELSHRSVSTQAVVIAAGATPTNDDLGRGVTFAKRSITAKSTPAAVPAGTSAEIPATLTYNDGSTEDVTITVKSKPTAPSFDNLENHGTYSGLSSISKVISGTAMPGAEKVKLTLQDGTVKEITPQADGSWSYTLGATEYLTQSFSGQFNGVFNRNKVKAVQVKDGVESEETTANVAPGQATVDSVYKAGRAITVNIPHDIEAGYVRVNGTDYGIQKVNGTWRVISTAPNAAKLEISNTVVDPTNKAVTKVTFSVKNNDDALYTPPFKIGNSPVRFRTHYSKNGTINTPTPQILGTDGWADSPTPKNTKPTVNFTADHTIEENKVFASPTVEELKDYFEGHDAEDDASLTVGYSASNRGKLRVQVFTQDTNQSVRANAQGRIDPGNYRLVLSTNDAADAESEPITRNIIVKTYADVYRDKVLYPANDDKVIYDDTAISNGNFTTAAKTSFKEKIQEANRQNTQLPTSVTYSVGNTDDKTKVAVINFPDGSTIDISHAVVAKPTVPTITRTHADKVSDADRTISGTALQSATKVTIYFQDGRGEQGHADVVPVNGQWTYTLPTGRYLRQTEHTSLPGSSSVPVNVTQTVFDATSDKTAVYVAKDRNFTGKQIVGTKGSQELTALENDAKKGINYTERNTPKDFPSDFDATWKETPDITTVGTRTYTAKVFEKDKGDAVSQEISVEVTVKADTPDAVAASYKQNGDAVLTPPTNADKVTITYTNQAGAQQTVKLSKTGGNWSVTEGDGTVLSGNQVVLPYKGLDRTQVIGTSATAGSDKYMSEVASQDYTVPEHRVTIAPIIRSNSDTLLSTAVEDAVTVTNKENVEKQGNLPTGIGKHTINAKVTYKDQSEEMVEIPYTIKPDAPSISTSIGTAGKNSVTVNNVTPGTTVVVYDMTNPNNPIELGRKDVSGATADAAQNGVTVSTNATLRKDTPIAAEVIYKPTVAAERIRSDKSSSLVVKEGLAVNSIHAVKGENYTGDLASRIHYNDGQDTGLPAGSTVEWKNNQEPDYNNVGTSRYTLVVNVPNQGTTEIEVPVHVYPTASLKKASYTNKQGTLSNGTDASKYVQFEGSVDTPNNVTVRWKDGVPDVSTVSADRKAKIEVVYPGNASATDTVVKELEVSLPTYHSTAKATEYTRTIGEAYASTDASDYVETTPNTPRGTEYAWKTDETGNQAYGSSTWGGANGDWLGKKTNKVKVYYPNADGGNEKSEVLAEETEEITFITKPAKPSITSDLTWASGTRTTVEVGNVTSGTRVVLYDEQGNELGHTDVAKGANYSTPTTASITPTKDIPAGKVYVKTIYMPDTADQRVESEKSDEATAKTNTLTAKGIIQTLAGTGNIGGVGTLDAATLGQLLRQENGGTDFTGATAEWKDKTNLEKGTAGSRVEHLLVKLAGQSEKQDVAITVTTLEQPSAKAVLKSKGADLASDNLSDYVNAPGQGTLSWEGAPAKVEVGQTLPRIKVTYPTAGVAISDITDQYVDAKVYSLEANPGATSKVTVGDAFDPNASDYVQTVANTAALPGTGVSHAWKDGNKPTSATVGKAIYTVVTSFGNDADVPAELRGQSVETQVEVTVLSTKPSKPEVSQNRTDLSITAVVGKDDATKAEITFRDELDQEHTVSFTKGANGQWDKDDANSQPTVQIINNADGTATVHMTGGTAKAGSTVVTKQQKADSDFSDVSELVAKEGLAGATATTKDDGSVEVVVPKEADTATFSYVPEGQTQEKTVTISKGQDGTWTAPADSDLVIKKDDATGSVTVTVPADKVADGSTVKGKVDSATKLSPEVEVKAKAPQPSEFSNHVRDNGDEVITLPQNADSVTINYPVSDANVKTVTISKGQDGTWTAPADSDLVIKKDDTTGSVTVTVPADKISGNRTITASAKAGSGAGESKERTFTTTVSAHQAPTVSEVTVAANGTPSAEQINAAVTAPKKVSAVAAEALKQVAAGSNTEIPVTVTYADGSTETVQLAVYSKQVTPSTVGFQQKDNGDAVLTPPTNADKVTITYTNQAGAQQTVKLSKTGGNWSVTEGDGTVLSGNQVVLPYKGLDRTQVIGTSATAGSDKYMSEVASQDYTVPEHRVTITTLVKPFEQNVTDKDLLDAINLEHKQSAKLKDGTSYPTTDGFHDIELTVTYEDGSTENVSVKYKVTDASKGTIYQAAKAKKDAIDGDNQLTNEEKKAAKDKVDAEAGKAKQAVDAATTNDGVTKAQNDAATNINNVDTTPHSKPNAKAEIDTKVEEANNAIDQNKDMTDDERREAKKAVKDAADKAKEAIDNTTTDADVTRAKNNGKQAINDINPQPAPRPNPVPTPRPDNGGNTNNGGDTNNDGNTGTSVTPSARSRRSVAFAGGTPSSQEKTVDKSELHKLVEELETRLKDLDGIDQSVIDATKIILREGQEALRNTDLTEAGLKEMTTKVKEALESLKGKQTTKDEETKETSKEQGHLPYGTMIGSLLALLGLLLFLIARRKRESELKKLTKELTKVLQDGDLTSVDAKLLDQVREALAQAVAFLANEKESDHTEDELIEKLKAVLAQLR
ncbi:surface anchored protein [Streptococcus pneumoniae]|nr:surface anchored protein [Streptococcus pneumoniae]